MRKFTQLFTNILSILFAFCGLFAVNETAWAANVAQTTAKLELCGSPKSTHSVTKNGVTFTIGGDNNTGGSLADYNYVKSGKEVSLTWSGVPSGYTINVTKITLDAKRYGLSSSGSGQYKTSKNGSYTSFCSSNSWSNYTLNSGSYFPLGNSGSISIKGNSREIDYKNIEFTYTIGNNYSIAFNANGGSGSMDNLTMVYYISKNLTANAFSRAYTVSYNVNGGVLDAALTSANTASNYNFDGWAISTDGDVVYANQASVSNLTEAVNGTYNLYAKWKDGGVTLPAGTQEGFFLEGWYDGETRVGHPGDTYYPTATVELKANWVKDLVPEFEGEGAENVMKVGANYTSFEFRNVSAAKPTNDPSDNFYYIIDNVSVNGNTAGCAEGTADKVISYNPATNTLAALNAGTADITFCQKAVPASHIVANSQKFTITVTKHDPEFSWTPQTYIFNSTYEDIFSSTNHDTQLSCSTTNNGAAEMVDGSNSYQKTLKTYNDASATITISQAENYYWEPKTVDNYVVSNSRVSNHVTFTYDQAMFDNNTITTSKVATHGADWDGDNVRLGGSNTAALVNSNCYDWDDKYIVIHFEGIPDSLIFEYKTTTNSASNAVTKLGEADWYVQESATSSFGSTKKWTSKRNSSDSYEKAIITGLNSSTRYLKLCYSGNFAGRFKNINVTELQYFKTATANLDFATNQLNHVPATQSFVVEHANAGYQTSVTAPDHYLVSLNNVDFASEVVYSTNATALTGGDIKNEFTVYVKYLADEEGTHNANVVVHNNLRSDINVPVTGTTQGLLSTHLVYKGAASYSVDADNIAATDLFEVRDANNALVENAVITLSKGETSVFNLANSNTELDPNCGGSATVTAHYAGDGVTYEAADDLGHTITIARLADEISFENGKAVLVTGDEFDLEGWASALSGTDITYTTASTTVISVEDGKVKAIGKGTATLTATSAGDCTYNSGIAKLTIKVRNASDPCETALLYKSSKHNINLYSGTQTYTIKEGPQDKLTFKVWKTSTVATYSADVKILDNSDNVLHTYTYSVGDLSTTEPETPNVEIDITQYPTARKISVSGSGTLYKYISELRVSQKAYLTASTTSVTMSSAKACETATGQFNISYSDLSTLHLSQTNENFTYEVWDGETKLDGFNNDCGDYGTYTVKFFYTPQAKGAYSNTVTISASGKAQVITLSGTANKPDRTIVWGIDAGNTITATQSLDLTAYARTSCQNPAGSIYYTASPADAATIDDNHITFNKAATVTVTAHTVTSDDYNDAAIVEKVWTVNKVGTQMRTLPTITSTITYGDNSLVVTYANDWVAEDVLSHEVVSGTIAYVGPASFDAAGEQNLTFNFTPNDLTVYDAMSFTVPVTVQQKASVATPVAANITYGQRVNESVLSSGAGSTTAGTWAWKDEEANTQVLAAREEVYTGLHVIFTPDNSNYATIETTVSLKVDKADPVVTPQASAITYGQAISASEISTASGDVTGTWEWAVDDTQVLSAGNHDLKVNFISGNTNYNNLSNVDVTLTVNKATSVATPTAADITAGQKVSESVLTNSGTAGVWAWDEAVKNTTPAAGTHNYTVHFTPDNANYTTLTTTVSLKVIAPMNEFTGTGDWEDPTNWTNGVPADDEPNVIVSGDLVIDDDKKVGNLTIESTGSIAVITGGTLTVKGTSESRSEYGDVHVLNDGALALGKNANLQVRHFTLDAKLAGKNNSNVKEAAASGQVDSVSNLHVNGDAYFQMTFDPRGAIDYGWYDFTVPFPVNINGGIERVNSSNDKVMVCGQDFLLMEADEVNRANGGKGWRQISNGALVPGKLYTITFDDEVNQNTFRFAWNRNDEIVSDSTYTAQCAPGSDESARGWNGMGNGMLCHGHLKNNYRMQAYDHASNTYNLVLEDKTFAVGSAFFIQVETAGDVEWKVAEATPARPLYAPRRAAESVEEFRLGLRDEATGEIKDALFFSASEEATEAYKIGHDLLKMGTLTDSKIARMWATKGGKKLCDVEATLVDDNASAPLFFFAPKAGSYELTIDAKPADATLYLTYNDAIIWDLTASPYMLDLTKGTTNGYGLRIEARRGPQVTTDIETVNAENGARKVLINNTIYIVTPEGRMYDIVGKGVKF